MFTFRKFHGCDTAHLNLRDQWWKERDNHKTIGLVSLDLSKTFDMLPHDLIVLKLGKSIADEKTICMAVGSSTTREIEGHVYFLAIDLY